MAKSIQATAEVFYIAFKALENDEKDAFLEKVISDPESRDDLVDLALMEKAKRVRGKPVAAKDYFARRRGKVKAL